MADIFGIGISALQAYQRALATTGHNVANASTPGYSRQRVLLATRPAEYTGAGYVGSGVQVASIERVFDGIKATQLSDATSGLARLEAFTRFAQSIGDLVADENVGLAGGFDRLSAALEDVATDPTSLPARQVLLNELQGLAGRFRQLSTQLDGMDQAVESGVRAATATINGLANSIAELNERIAAASSSGSPPNDLLDERSRILNELAAQVGISTTEESNGAVNVFIGSGQALVTGFDARELTVARDRLDPQRSDILLGGASVASQLSGGQLGGLLDARGELIDPARNELGRLAAALALRVNEVNAQGFDLDGNPGGDLLTVPAPTAVAATGNAGSGGVSVSFADSSAFRSGPYVLAFDGSAYALRSVSTGATVAMTGSGTTADPFLVDGLEIVVTPGSAAGDRFLIQPFRATAGAIAVSEADPRRIAAAAVAGAVGDNRNALQLAGVIDEKILDSGTASVVSGNAALIARVGSAAQQSDIARQAQSTIKTDAEAAMAAVSGVNLDEEAANLLRYQQAYEAMAQVMAVADTMFQTLIGALRR